MKLTRVIKLKLSVSPKVFQPTVDSYTSAFNLVCQTGWQDQDFNGVSLHKKTYTTTRQYLPSQLACSARMKATEALKGAKARLKKKQKATCPQSKRTAVRYDARSYNVWFERNEVSLLTIKGRQKCSISIPEHFKQYLNWRRASAELFIRDDNVFLYIVMDKDVPDTVDGGNYVGIDRGIKKIIVTSNNHFVGGGRVKRVSRRYERLRSILQSAGTRSAKRHFAKIRRKENRFRTHENHCVSKQVVDSLPVGSTIVLEDLTNIRQRMKLRKHQRKEVHKWSFFQLEQFLTYKAAFRGIPVVKVDARYTSQKCSHCGYISRSNRNSQSCFKCKQCSFSLNADLNAARNIRNNYQNAISHSGRAVVNQPTDPPLGVDQAAML